MKPTNYNTEYFIEKFAAIPEDRWCNEVYQSLDRYCALGHCGITNENCRRTDDQLPEATALTEIFKAYGTLVSWVNDGYNEHFQQDHPKKRILAALAKIKNEEA